MKYRINRNFADKYKGRNNKEGLFLTLEYVLRKCDYDGDINRIREGDAQDIDGIISILLEYGVLEEVDSEEDDSEEYESENECFFERIKKKFEDMGLIMESEDKEDNDDSSHKSFCSVRTLKQLKEKTEELPETAFLSYIDRVILQINGKYVLYTFPMPDKRDAEGLLLECLEHERKIKKKVQEDSDKKPQGFGLVKFMCDSIGLSIDDLRSKIESDIKNGSEKEDSDKKDFEAADKLSRKIEIIKLGELLEGLQGSDESLSSKHEKDFKEHMEFMMKRYK